MADERVDRHDRERLDGRGQVVRETLGGGNALDPRAAAVAAQVDGDHAPATIGQRGADAPPGSPPAGDAVDEDGNRRGCAGIGRAGRGPGGRPFVRGQRDRLRHRPIVAAPERSRDNGADG